MKNRQHRVRFGGLGQSISTMQLPALFTFEEMNKDTNHNRIRADETSSSLIPTFFILPRRFPDSGVWPSPFTLAKSEGDAEGSVQALS